VNQMLLDRGMLVYILQRLGGPLGVGLMVWRIAMVRKWPLTTRRTLVGRLLLSGSNGHAPLKRADRLRRD
jgi:hypothetical protein